MKNPFRRLSACSIRTKYIIAMSVLLLTFVVSFLFVGGYFSRVAFDNAMQSAEADMQLSYTELDRFEKRMLRLNTLVQSNNDALELMEAMPTLSAPAAQAAMSTLMPLVYLMSDGSDDYFSRLYVDTGGAHGDSTSRLPRMQDVRDTPWFQSAMSGWGWHRFYSAQALGADDPALLTPIRSTEMRTTLIGLLRVDIRTSALERLLLPVRSGEYVTAYLESPEGELIAMSGVPVDAPDYLSGLTTSQRTGFAANDLHTFQTGVTTVSHRRLPGSGWLLCFVVHHDILSRITLRSTAFILWIGLLLILTGMLCALPIIWSTSTRIRLFHAHVQRYAEGALTASEITPDRFPPDHPDELGELIRVHNAMLDRIDALIRQQTQHESELRRLEIFAMQAQVKPHFLYNTLEAINWMARFNQPEKVERTVQNLTKFYRLCLSNGSDVLPLETELEIVRRYFAIANARYQSAYTLDIDTVPRAMSCMLPKLTLQPLVENALIHGLLESDNDSGSGAIRIYTRAGEDGLIELCIADTGAHFTQARWDSLFSSSPPADSMDGAESYGLRNVERRLCLFYNRDAVLRLDTGDPTLTVIVLPLYAPGPHAASV